MLYGPDYDGPVRECDNCGTRTSCFATCSECDETICDGCDHTCPEHVEDDMPHIDDCPVWAGEACACSSRLIDQEAA